MKKRSDWYEYIVEGLWVLSFLATILWIADANDNPLIKGIKGAVYEPLTIVFTLLASFTTWIYPKITPVKKKKTPKDVIPQRRKVLIVATGLAIIFGLILYSLRAKEPSKEIVTNSNDSTQLECYFPKKFQKDTLYILITRFEDYFNKTETTCFGRSLRDRIDVKANKNHIPIKICYTDKFSPQTVTDVKALQKRYNADLVLWGRLKNVLKDCSEGDFCFLSQPSDTLIRLVGGEIDVEQMDLEYEQKISPSKIEQGEFHVDSLSFDHWLAAIYNIKIGRNNPDLYLIDKDLTTKEQVEQYKQRGDLFYNLQNNNKALLDYSKAIELKSDDSEAYNNRGSTKNNLKDYTGAMMDYNKAIALKPDFAEAYNNRGVLKNNINNLKGAIMDYDKAIKLNPNFSIAYSNRGCGKDDLKHYQEAIRDYDKAIKLNPNNSENYHGRGVVKYNLKDYIEAIKEIKP
jgi:tetratricopeptide (TPR) repeat protein